MSCARESLEQLVLATLLRCIEEVPLMADGSKNWQAAAKKGAGAHNSGVARPRRSSSVHVRLCRRMAALT